MSTNTLQINVYTASNTALAPAEAKDKHFVRLGCTHNYGQLHELVLWISKKNDIVIPYISLLYSFEIKQCICIASIDIKNIIPYLKDAIKLYNTSMTSPMHTSYMLLCANRALDSLLCEHSMFQLQLKSAAKIQMKWLDLYYNPNKYICKLRLLRQFDELIDELKLQKST